ncbi:MAG: primosomal protein N' [Candidatus Omnitrophota bacterium]|jgi:primosomal protein N' (replication factor Y)|nr:MAG: primosomal protein N' [Candidatus Omnitrophota bacterium]
MNSIPDHPAYVEVAFPIPVRQEYTYQISEALRGKVKPGCRLYAQLGNRDALGYAAKLRDDAPAGVANIKSIHRLVDDEPLFGVELLKFLQWVADYYLASLGETFAAAYPFAPNVRPRMVKVVILDDRIRESGRIPETVQRDNHRRVLEFLINRKSLLSPSDIVREVGVSTSTLKSLEKNGLVHIDSRESLRETHFAMHESGQSFTLTEEQHQAIKIIEQSLHIPSPKPILLQGVTGSGKTEVYLQSIERVLQMRKTALVLIPEISLTPQTMDRFRSRFGESVGILHSSLGQGERYDEWRLARQGKRRIIVGTRSAIFAPLDNLGIVIVDEEHEGSYKQNDPNPRYHGRDLAVARANMAGVLCLLGSATPAIESSYNVRTGKYGGIRLTQRVSRHGLAGVQLIDMRGRSEEEEILSKELQEALWIRYENRQQSILFLNRRGFATTLTCKHCGQVITCDHCSVALVYHRSRNLLLCHHCDFRRDLPDICPSCHDKFIRQRGFGTERVVQKVESIIPEARVVRLDKDTTSRKGDHERLLTPFRRGEADVLVGTQMIAKGLDFPNVTLVGVINADYALSLPDFRAAERTFTLLTQVAGRAGRGENPGDVFLQSYCPDHYSIQLAIYQNYDAFYEREIRYRRLITFPPFSRLVLWRIESAKEDLARGNAWELYNLLADGLKNEKTVTILPPVEAPLYRLRDHFRWQVALKSRDYRAYRPLLASEALKKFLLQRPKGLRIVQDVDPWDML